MSCPLGCISQTAAPQKAHPLHRFMWGDVRIILILAMLKQFALIDLASIYS